MLPWVGWEPSRFGPGPLDQGESSRRRRPGTSCAPRRWAHRSAMRCSPPVSSVVSPKMTVAARRDVAGPPLPTVAGLAPRPLVVSELAALDAHHQLAPARPGPGSARWRPAAAGRPAARPSPSTRRFAVALDGRTGPPACRSRRCRWRSARSRWARCRSRRPRPRLGFRPGPDHGLEEEIQVGPELQPAVRVRQGQGARG